MRLHLGTVRVGYGAPAGGVPIGFYWCDTSPPHASDSSDRSACPMTSSSFRRYCRARIFEIMSRSDFMTRSQPLWQGSSTTVGGSKIAVMHSNVMWARSRADAHGRRVEKSSGLDALLLVARSTRRRATLPRTISLHLSLTLVCEVHLLAPHGEVPRRVTVLSV